MEDMFSDDMFFQSNVNQLFGTSSAAQLVAGCILEVDPPAWRQVVALLPRLKLCYLFCNRHFPLKSENGFLVKTFLDKSVASLMIILPFYNQIKI